MSYIGNQITQQSFTGGVDQFNGNASNTAFGLSRTINTVYDIDVYVENVWQRPTTGYTVSANTITFTSAPSSGSNNVVVVYRNFSATSVIPQQGSVVASSLSANLIPSVISGSALSGITTLAAGNTTITGTANVSSDLVSNTLTVSTNTATFGTTVYSAANGNVGIRKSTPVAPIHIYGTGTSGQTNAAIIIENGSSGTLGIDITGSAGSSYARMRYGGGPGTGTNSMTGDLALIGLEGSSIGFQQIKFAPTQVASSDANTLDDYEEGTFTPTFTSSGTLAGFTYVTQLGSYVKIGKTVYFALEIQISGLAGGSSGNVRIANLPFTASITSTYGAVSIAYAYTSGGTQPNGAMVRTSATHIEIFSNSGGGVSSIGFGSLAAVDWYIGGTYTASA